jgi:MFS family permease
VQATHVHGPPTVAAAVALSVIGSAAFLILPQLIEAAVADLHFSDQQVGFLSSLLMLGSTVSAVAATFWVRRLSWRRAALTAAVGLLGTNLTSLVYHAAWPFMLLQCLSGFFGGSLYSLSLTVLSDSRHADRHFGFAVAAQVAFQVVGLLIGPALLRAAGMNAFLTAFLLLNVLAAALVPLLPVGGSRGKTSGGAAPLWTAPTLLALAGCFLFFFNVGSYWTYIELIGTRAGLATQVIANGLAVGVAFGIAGALLASWLGDRRGRLLPIGVGAALTVGAVVPLLAHFGVVIFVGSAIVYNFVWNLSLAFQYSTVNAVDRSGRGVAAAPAFHAAGAAAGPAVAAFLIAPGNFRPVIFLVAASVLLSFGCFRLATRPGKLLQSESY